MTESYYVRKRGRITGPFHIDELLRLRDQGRITRVHELSPDRIEWTPAFELQQVFQAYIELPEDNASYSLSNSTNPRNEFGPAKGGTEWYYVENGNRVGPVPLASLRQLATQGVVQEETLVWCDDLTDWSAAARVPQLANEFPQQTGRPLQQLSEDQSVVTASTDVCSACGNGLHPTAKRCPTCGMARNRRRNRGIYFLAVLVAIVFSLAAAFVATFVLRQSPMGP